MSKKLVWFAMFDHGVLFDGEVDKCIIVPDVVKNLGAFDGCVETVQSRPELGHVFYIHNRWQWVDESLKDIYGFYNIEPDEPRTIYFLKEE